MKKKIEMLQRFAEAKASDAIESIHLTAAEEALFHHMIDLELDGNARAKMITDYLAGDYQIPPHKLAAE